MKKLLILFSMAIFALTGCSKSEEVEEITIEETVTKHIYDWENNNLITTDVKVSDLNSEILIGVNTLSTDELNSLVPISVYDEKDHAENGSGDAINAKDIIKYNKETLQNEVKPNTEKPVSDEKETSEDKKPITDNKLEITNTSVDY